MELKKKNMKKKSQFAPYKSEERCGQEQPTKDFEVFMWATSSSFTFPWIFLKLLQDMTKKKNHQNFIFTYVFKYVNKNN